MSGEPKDAGVTLGVVETELQSALHEVSNALTVVLGWLGVAEGELDANFDGTSALASQCLGQALTVAHAHAQRAHGVARSAIGAKPYTAPAPSGASLIQQTIEAAEPAAKRKGVTLQAVPGDHSDSGIDPARKLPIRADAQREVLQVLLNLVLNAIAFTPSGGSVCVSVRVAEQRAIWRVADDGPGVADDLVPNLFTGCGSQREGGAGIGLSHSKQLAARQGGDLRLVKQPSGTGATFELVWPLEEAHVPQSSAASDRSRARGKRPSLVAGATSPQQAMEGLNVLVLEDDSAVSTMLEFGLTSRGAHVTTTSDLTSLASVLETNAQFDAALLDYSPIQADPNGAISALKSSQGRMPIILISGSAIAPHTELPIEMWVQKPFELNEVYAALVEATRATGNDQCADVPESSCERSSVRATGGQEEEAEQLVAG